MNEKLPKSELLCEENKHKKKYKKTYNKTSNKKHFYDEIKKTFGEDKDSLTSTGKVYSLTVSTNILITLVVALIFVYIANSVNLLEFKFTIAELFLTAMVLFALWNCLVGYVVEGDSYKLSTNMSLFIAVFVLPLVKNGPGFLIDKFC